MAEADDRGLLVPATYRVTFPARGDFAPAGGLHVVEVTLAELEIVEYGLVTGRAGDTYTQHSAVWAACETAIVPDNVVELQALAERAARDFYLWALSLPTTELEGTVPWVMEGHTGVVEFRHLPGLLDTRLSRDARGSWQGEQTALGQSSPDEGSDPTADTPADGDFFFNWATLHLANAILQMNNTTFNLLGPLLLTTGTGLDAEPFRLDLDNIEVDRELNINLNFPLNIIGVRLNLLAPVEICSWLYLCHDSYTLSGQVNNWEPPNYGTDEGQVIVRITPTTSDSLPPADIITGIAFEGIGQVLILWNVHATRSFSLYHEDTDSLAENRIRLPEGKLEWFVRPRAAVLLWYDPDESRWMAFGDDCPVIAKGDIYTRTATSRARLGIGAPGQILAVDDTQDVGMRWIDLPAADGPQWVRVTLGHADFAAAATTNTINLYSVPAKSVVHGVYIKHSAAFTGGSISAYRFDVGHSGSPEFYITFYNVNGAPSDTDFGHWPNHGSSGSGLAPYALTHAAWTMTIRATSTGGNLDTATAGTVDVWILVSTLPT